MVMIYVDPKDKIYSNKDPKHRWHKTWAIFPVTTISGTKVWWKPVYARYFWYIDGIMNAETGLEYGTIFDVLKYPD